MYKSYSVFLFLLVPFSIFPLTAYADLNDGLIAYYPFNGNTNDESGNGNNGITYGAPVFAADRFGNVNSAISFDGVDDYIDIGSDVVFDMQNEITISAWVNRSATASEFGPIITKWKTGPSLKGSWYMAVTDGGLPYYIVSGNGASGAANATSNIPVVPGQFEHVVGLYNIADNIIRIYLNGTEVGIAPGESGSIYVSDAKIHIGAANYSSSIYFEGIIDDIRIYNRALSPSEIVDLYNEIGGVINIPPTAVAGTSLDGNSLLQLDGSLTADANNDPLNFSWQISGEVLPRLGQIVSIADLMVGNYSVTLTVDDGKGGVTTDSMLLGIPEGTGSNAPPTTNMLLQSVVDMKNMVIAFPTSSFDAPNDNARENRRKAMLNMMDKIYNAIDIEDYQAAIDQLRDIQGKTDGLVPPTSAHDWIIGAGAQSTYQAIFSLINELQIVCGNCV